MQDFHDLFICASSKFSVGRNDVLGVFYISYPEPTPNRQSDYEVYYKLPDELVNTAINNPIELGDFVNECRQGLHANLKITN